VVSKWLHLAIPVRAKQRTQIDIELSDSAKSFLTEIVVPDGSNAIGKQLVDLRLPKTALISFIQRDSQFITPNGATRLKPNDKLYVISENKQDVEKVFDSLEIKDKS
jgi:cell volume regulation protein A